MKRGELAYIDLPLISGSRVQGGRRPAVLVISDSAIPNNPMVMIVPLTTATAAKRFPFTFEIPPTSENGLTAPSIALVFQLSAADRTHVGRIIGNLEDNHISQINEMMRKLLDLK